MVLRLTVDLDAPPRQRWGGLAPFAAEAVRLVEYYERDLGLDAGLRAQVAGYLADIVSEPYLEELRGVADVVGCSLEQAAIGNLYYDALKVVLGCTAVSMDRSDGPVHARNLDWWSAEGALTQSTAVIDFVRSGELVFRSVGWPGFIGVMSGVAPGRFAITLNAVLSEEPTTLATPVVFLIRDVLETAPSFEDAVRRLCDTPILTDVLLLVTGAEAGQRVVIERTPTRHAVRTGHPLVVTNDYRALSSSTEATTELQRTSCGRFDRASALAQAGAAPFDILTDEAVRMDITVHHMVLRPATGQVQVRLPKPR